MFDIAQSERTTSNGSSSERLKRLNKPLIIVGIIIILIAIGIAYRHLYPSVPTVQEISYAQHLGQYNKAIELTKQAISKAESNKQRAGLYAVLANNYLNNKQPELAIESYKKAASITRMTANLAYIIASTYHQENNSKQAIKYYTEAIRLWPKKDPLYDAQINAIQQDINTLQNSLQDQE